MINIVDIAAPIYDAYTIWLFTEFTEAINVYDTVGCQSVQ